jgi:hypothetical protein
MTETAGHSETIDRELAGCPVAHRDFAPQQAAGCHWQLADELRATSPAVAPPRTSARRGPSA